MRSSIWLAALAALLLPAAAAAGPGSTASLAHGSALALPVVDLASVALAAGSGDAAPTLALSTPLVAPVRYRPRASRDRGRAMPTTMQLHVGFMDPSESFSTGFYGGFRAGPQVDPRVQVGVSLDWWHRSESQSVRIEGGPLPGGGTGDRELELSRSSADLVPILAFVQVSGDENMPVIPYGGAGLGYQALFLSADDVMTGTSFDATYGGFAWQLWGGAALPLSGRTRLTGEVFYNGGEVGRDVDYYDYGYLGTYRELVKMDGVGMRVGIAWGF